MPRAAAPDSRIASRKLEMILRHSARVFAEKGYEGASIRDISRASGVSLSGLYYYVESKQKLLYLIQIHTFSTILSRLRRDWKVCPIPLPVFVFWFITTWNIFYATRWK